ncbi:MAG TPA: carboxypeptidase-like regulatory domain-containing protein, partial [Flavisolibacter sp.]
MRKIFSALSFLFLSLFFIQCQREVSFLDVPAFPGEVVKPDPITSAIQGNVLDENGAPAVGVTIEVGPKITITDSKGYFRINDASLDKKSALVTASKPGYFDAYRTFAATSGANQVVIKLIKKTLAGTIDATTGGEVTLSNGSKVALPANGVVNAATSAAYTGQVNVYAAYIDPSAADIAQTVPGSFMANDNDGKRRVLTSYGMMAVELEAASGEKLQIKSGSKAKLTTAIPANAQSSSPSTIALWNVDETTGIWKREGAATKNGNAYVGDVSHFSIWSTDTVQTSGQISATLKLSSGQPFVYGHVRVRQPSSGWNYVAYGYTDTLGQVNLWVPFNVPLVLETLDPCGLPMFSQNIGPFTQNTNLGDVILTNTAGTVARVKGKLVDCNNAPVTNGVAIVYLGNFVQFVNTNGAGEFETNFTRCANSPGNFEIVGIDETAQQQTTVPVTVPVTSPLTDAGSISACGASATEYINYTLDGASFNLTSPVD